MRFGKRSKNPLLWGWRTKSNPEKDDGALHEEEQGETTPEDEATVSEEGEEMDMSTAPSPASNPAGDPTQRLLTALGRFQRQIARARDGLPQEAWSDECMTQLINAVEIALAQGWNDVVKTLTETARILQSYEDVGKAQQCTGFLNDSYEILCLMVGDLIVGNVRSGVIDKWQKRYDLALEEMDEAGVPLVKDDDFGESEPAEAPPQPEYPEPEPAPEVEPESPAAEEPETPMTADGIETPFGGVVESDTTSIEVEVPELESFFGEQEADENEQAQATEEETTPCEEDNLDQAVESLINDMAQGQYDEQPERFSPDTSEEPPAQDESAGTEAESVETDAVGVTGRKDLPPHIVDVLDSLCEELAQLADDEIEDVEPIVANIEERLALLEQHAVDSNHDGAVLPCLAMGRMVRLVAGREAAMPDDRFFELAYAFCGLYAEADQASAPAIQNWLTECDDLLVEWAAQARNAHKMMEPETGEEPATVESVEHNAGPPQEEPEAGVEPEPLEPLSELEPLEDEETPEVEPVAEPPVAEPEATETDAGTQEPPNLDEILDVLEPREPTAEQTVNAVQNAVDASSQPHPDKRTAESLLETAFRAMSDGNVSNAKLFAMQAAAEIGEAQIQQAEAQVEHAELQLKKGAEETDQARGHVHDIEESVAESENRVAESEQQLGDAKGQKGEVAQELEHADALINEIDEQIRALQLQREDAVRRRDETKERYFQSETHEADIQRRLEEARQAEMDARVALEDARQRVKALERKRAENEAAMERAREMLERQRNSYADIERTIAQICSAETTKGENGENELLF